MTSDFLLHKKTEQNLPLYNKENLYKNIHFFLSFLLSSTRSFSLSLYTVLYFYGLSSGCPLPVRPWTTYFLRFPLSYLRYFTTYQQSQRIISLTSSSNHHHRSHHHHSTAANLTVLMKITKSATLETTVAVPDWAIPAVVELRIDLLRAAPSITLLLSSSSCMVQLGPLLDPSRLTLLKPPLLPDDELETPHVGVGRQIRVRFGA